MLALPATELESSAAAQGNAVEAERVIQRAEELFDARNYEAALAEFGVAFGVLAGDSRRAAMLSNMALCQERLFRYDLALDLYEQYLREASPEARGRADAEVAVAKLRGLLGAVAVESNVDAEVWVDARRVGRAPGTLSVPAGRHTVELRAPLREAARREVVVIAGQPQRLRFELERLSQYRGISSAYFWTSSALTLVALGVGTGFGISALAADSDGDARRARDPLLNTIEDQDAVKSRVTAADVAFIAAAVLGASSFVLFFVTDFGNDAEPTTKPLTVSAGPGGVSLRARF